MKIVPGICVFDGNTPAKKKIKKKYNNNNNNNN